ncbi:hypothetical protein FA15DRAFT_663336 [Coprinopsis marcescibilis]|uniref:Uncharacterized protein n=1 Tax=Coprinopsis marcescibilis TaxID=230819 RepID=A0A5C3LDM5_COPMA|nr:hypothetical protein FA15DRAFT_663336 [Coprinopsis marcescibilis]
MDAWPQDTRDSRITSSTYIRSKGDRSEYIGNAYPHIRQGMAGAATLVKKAGRLEWSFLKDPTAKARSWKLTETHNIFPCTRAPPFSKPTQTIKQRAEHGANFLRTHLADLDIPAEVIRDQLVEEAALESQLQKFDPQVGSLLAVMSRPVAAKSVSGCLAFAMGEVLNELNILNFSIHKDKPIVLRPTAESKISYNTPIRQLVAGGDSILAVRTLSDTHVLRVGKSTNTRLAETLATYPSGDLSNRNVFDIKLTKSELITVDHSGVIHVRDFGFSKKPIATVTPFEDQLHRSERFWRLGLDSNLRNGFLVSSDQLWSFDWREKGALRRDFSLQTPDYITSVEDGRGDNIVRLCSTSSLLWLDQRQMRRPLLSLKHYREFDRYLQIKTVGDTSPVTFLSTRKNKLISVYDASRGADHFFHSQSTPWELLPQSEDSQTSIGDAILSYPFELEPSNAVFFRLSEQAGLYAHKINSGDQSSDFPVQIISSNEIDNLALKSKKLSSTLGPLDGREYSEVDFSGVYEKLFRQYNENAEKFEESEAQEVYDLLDNMPSYFQRLEVPNEHLLSTYDVAFRAGEEPKSASRSDFLTGSILNSRRGYRGFQQGRLDSQTLSKGVAWHAKLDEIVERLDRNLASDMDETGKNLARYEVADYEQRPVESLRLEKANREQLTLDLALSQDVYSNHPLIETFDVDHALETMTEALTLGEEPPAVDFSFLKPSRRDHYNRAEATKGIALGTATRLLLKEWDIGTNPDSYRYRNPYTAGNEIAREPPPSKFAFPYPTPQSEPAPTPRPPQVVIGKTANPHDMFPKSSSQPQVQQPMAGGSQQLGAAPRWQDESQTQGAPMASTQVLPGVFGGRPAVKKKPAKRRVGGF